MKTIKHAARVKLYEDDDTPPSKPNGILTAENLPAITAGSVAAFIVLPSIWPILKKVLLKSLPVVGTAWNMYDAWDNLTQGNWKDAVVNVGLAGLSIGQIFGYVAGGAPGVAATIVDITGNLYTVRDMILRLYYEKIEGIDISGYNENDLKDAADQLIGEIATQLAHMAMNGIYDAGSYITGSAEQADPKTATKFAELPPLPKMPEKPIVPEIPAAAVPKIAELAKTRPQIDIAPPPTTPGATIQPVTMRTVTPDSTANYDEMSFKDAFKNARALARRLDPENPGVYTFMWNDKPYQTNVTGEPSLPMSKQRKLIQLDSGTQTLAEGKGDFLKWFGKILGFGDDVVKSAEEAGTALKLGQTADDAGKISKELDAAVKAGSEVTAGILNDASKIVNLNGRKYAKYYDQILNKWKWVDLQKAEAGSRRSAGFVDDAVAKELDDALSIEAKAGTDAAKPPASSTELPKTPTTPTTPKITPEAIAALKKTPVEKWTAEQLASLGYNTSDVPFLSAAKSVGLDIAASTDEIVRLPWYKSWSSLVKLKGAVSSNLLMAALYGVIPVWEAIEKQQQLDPNDPNYQRRVYEIWAECTAKIGIQATAAILGGAIARKLIGKVTSNNKAKWIAILVGEFAGLTAEQIYIDPHIESIVQKASDFITGTTIPRVKVTDPDAQPDTTPTPPVTTPKKPTVKSPEPTTQPNYDDLPFKDAFARARERARQLSPGNAGQYTFMWRGKPYQTNYKGSGTSSNPSEPYIPQSKQRGMVSTAPLNEAGLKTWAGDSLISFGEWLAKMLGRGEKIADIGADAGKIAGKIVDATIGGKQYKYFDDVINGGGYWYDVEKAAAGGRKSAGKITKESDPALFDELSKIRSAEADAAAAAGKAVDDAGAGVAASERLTAKLSPEAIKALRTTPVEKWTTEQLASCGYNASHVPMLSAARSAGIDIVATGEEMLASSWWKGWSLATGAGKATLKLSAWFANKTLNVVFWGWMVGDAAIEGLGRMADLDPNDPNYTRRVTEIWVEEAAKVGTEILFWHVAGALSKFGLRKIGVAEKWPALSALVIALSKGSGALLAKKYAMQGGILTGRIGIQDIVEMASNFALGPIDRSPGAGTLENTALYKKAYKWALESGATQESSVRYAKMVAAEGPNGPIASQLDKHVPTFESVQLAYLYNKLDESTTARNTINIHNIIKRMLSESSNSDVLERSAYIIQMSGILNEDADSDNFMTNVTAAIAANTKGDKVGAQKALDAAKLSNPATGTDQTNQKNILDQLTKANPSLAVPDTNPNSTQNQTPNPNATQSNVEEAGGIGGGVSSGVIHDQHVGANAAEVIQAYNEFAAQYPVAKFLLDIMPVTGAATSVIDASQDLHNGKYGQAALDMLGALPGFKIGKYLSRGLQGAVKLINKGAKAGNIGNATSNLIGNTIQSASESIAPKMGDSIMLELADGRVIVAPISELRGNSMIVTLDETAHQWLDESPGHDALKIGDSTQSISSTAQFWNSMIDTLTHDTPAGWAQLFVNLQNTTGHVARTMPHQWSNIWRQQHIALGDEITRSDMMTWVNEVESAIDQSGLEESSHNPAGGSKLRKMLDSKDPAMLAVWMSSRAGNKGISVAKFAKDKAVQSGLPANHWWSKIKNLVNETTDPYSMEKRYYIVRKTSSAAPVDGISGFHRKSEADKKLATMKNPDQYMVRAIDSTKLPKDEFDEASIPGINTKDTRYDHFKHGRWVIMVSKEPVLMPALTGPNPKYVAKAMLSDNPRKQHISVAMTQNGAVEDVSRKAIDANRASLDPDDYEHYVVDFNVDFTREYMDPKTGHFFKFEKGADGQPRLISVGPEWYQKFGTEMDQLGFRRASDKSSRDIDTPNTPTYSFPIGKPMVKQLGLIPNMRYSLEFENEDADGNDIFTISQHSRYTGKGSRMMMRTPGFILAASPKNKTDTPPSQYVNDMPGLASAGLDEAEYKGKSVPLSKPIRTSPSEGGKFKVYVKDPKTGNIKMVRFGDTTGLSIKRDDPKRRKNYRARHHCENPGPKTKANYWSCKMWTAKPVGKILKGK